MVSKTEMVRVMERRAVCAVRRQKGEPTLCSCGTITTMGYRTAAIAGEMPNGLKDRAGLAVRTTARSGMAARRQKQAGKTRRRDFKRSRLCSSASALYPPLLI